MSDMSEPLIAKDAKHPQDRTTYVARTLAAGMGSGYGAKKDFSAVDAGFVCFYSVHVICELI